ncbi:unnamed protein product, partial [Brachionus calyciflorus]
RISKYNREDLLPYKKNISSNIKDDRLWFCVKFNKPYHELNRMLKYCWLNNLNATSIKFSPSYSVNNNLRNILVHGAKFDLKNKNFFCDKYTELDCKTSIATVVLKIVYISYFVIYVTATTSMRQVNLLEQGYINPCTQLKVLSHINVWDLKMPYILI